MDPLFILSGIRTPDRRQNRSREVRGRQLRVFRVVDRGKVDPVFQDRDRCEGPAGEVVVGVGDVDGVAAAAAAAAAVRVNEVAVGMRGPEFESQMFGL